MNKNIAFLLALIIALEAILIVKGECSRDPITNTDCGSGCTGRPRCGGSKRCGNIDNVCYCDCSQYGQFKCRATNLGLRWNNGAKYSNGTYRFDGVVGDGNAYDC